MTTTAYAIKQLEKAGATVTKDAHIFNRWNAQFPAARIEVNDQDGEAITIYVIKNGEEDELLSDYFAGHFMSNVKRAIALARRMETWNLPPDRTPAPVNRFEGFYSEL